MRHARIFAAVVAIALGGAHLAVSVPTAAAGTLYLTACSQLHDNGQDTDVSGPVWQAKADAAYALYNRCPQGGSFQIATTRNPAGRTNAQWATVTPPSIEIVQAQTPVNDVLVDSHLSGDGYSASFFWQGGTQAIVPENSCCGGMYYGAGINRSLGPSRWFGFQVSCSYSPPCGNPAAQLLDVNGIELTAVDNTQPSLLALGADNIWYQTAHWIRASGWPASFQASTDDGICGMQAIVDGGAIPGPSDPNPNQHSWTQCPDPQTMSLSIDTTRYPDGPLSLTLSASDAASPANVSSPSETLHVDNQPVGLTMGGPTDAPSTAGTQYVDATASAGPSGVAGIACSTDSSPYQWQPGSSAQIPVAGVGEHAVSCYSQNLATDVYGNPGRSTVQTWRLKIGQPTALAVGFRRVVDALRCHRARKRIRVPGHWVTVRRHHRRIHVRRRAHYRAIRVVSCHPRTATRHVTAYGTIKRGGKKVHVPVVKTVRVVLLPHIVYAQARRLRFGHGVAVSGWLGTTGGTALAGEPVAVLTAPENGEHHWRVATVATTRSDGSWSVRLRPGPSRLIKVAYAGSPTTESTVSTQVKVVVPSKVLLHIRPTRTRWGATIRIWGRVLGGYIPPGKLLRLRIGADGMSGTVGIPDISSSGRFHTTWKFASGTGVVRYWFSVSTLAESSYAYAPTSSKRMYVTVGP